MDCGIIDFLWETLSILVLDFLFGGVWVFLLFYGIATDPGILTFVSAFFLVMYLARFYLIYKKTFGSFGSIYAEYVFLYCYTMNFPARAVFTWLAIAVDFAIALNAENDLATRLVAGLGGGVGAFILMVDTYIFAYGKTFTGNLKKREIYSEQAAELVKDRLADEAYKAPISQFIFYTDPDNKNYFKEEFDGLYNIDSAVGHEL